MRFFLVFLLMAFSGATMAQNLAGIWRGKRTQVSGGCFPEYFIELHVTYAGSNIMILGNAYNYYDKDRYTKINFTGRYNPATKRMVIIENLVLQFNVPSHCIPCIKTYDLNYTKNDSVEAFVGEWKGHEMGNNNICPPGRIQLNRETTSIFPVDVFQNDTLNKIQKSLNLADREKEVIKELVFDTSQIRIDIYDNAEIDDDTVSVFLNNTLLLHKKRLTATALSLQVTAYPNTDYELMMYADNLGKIPPNTSLMIITAGTKRYELRISSSEKKSAVVRFRYLPTKKL
ncbi:hypothetical protein [Flavitalea sp.]|nr:hypothetical protein [Flavitalea sp.]